MTTTSFNPLFLRIEIVQLDAIWCVRHDWELKNYTASKEGECFKTRQSPVACQIKLRHYPLSFHTFSNARTTLTCYQNSYQLSEDTVCFVCRLKGAGKVKDSQKEAKDSTAQCSRIGLRFMSSKDRNCVVFWEWVPEYTARWSWNARLLISWCWLTVVAFFKMWLWWWWSHKRLELKLESSFLHNATTTRHFYFSTLLGNSLKLRLLIRSSNIRFEMRRNLLITRLLVLVPQWARTNCSISYDPHGWLAHRKTNHSSSGLLLIANI